MKIGIVGYGTGGQHFHAPFILATEGVRLGGVVARAEGTVAKIRADLPDVPIYASLTEMIQQGDVDAVTITTPPHTRRSLVLEAIEAGLHVIADKPFAPDADGARVLDAAARDKGVLLGVYHNRRFDSDVQTLKKILDEDRLGRIWRFHNRMDFDDPATLEAGPTGGLLRDLGSHLVDQALFLLGPAVAVSAQMDMVDLAQGRTDASFTITLHHDTGAHSHISASKLNQLNHRELRAYGEHGAYVSQACDIQAQSIFSGKRPADDLDAWGYEPEPHWGTLHVKGTTEPVPSEQGRYHDYYAAFRDAVTRGAPLPVTGADGIRVLKVLDAVFESAQSGSTVLLD